MVETDYSSQSLESALQDQDAVISALGHAALDKQIALIEAAEKAGVRRFVPSDFGLPRGATDVPGYTAILAKKHQVADLLKEKAEQNPRFTWSTFINGPFLDRVCTNPTAASLSLSLSLSSRGSRYLYKL